MLCDRSYFKITAGISRQRRSIVLEWSHYSAVYQLPFDWTPPVVFSFAELGFVDLDIETGPAQAFAVHFAAVQQNLPMKRIQINNNMQGSLNFFWQKRVYWGTVEKLDP